MNQFPKRGVFPVGQEPVPWIAPLPQSVRRRWRKQIPLQGNLHTGSTGVIGKVGRWISKVIK